MYLTIKQQTLFIARQLRKNMTPAEKLFWQHIRHEQFHQLRFLRQHPLFYSYNDHLKFFIADFYCHQLRLVIEIDGGIHESQKDYDVIRTDILQTMKLKVVRFKNEDVLNNIEKVLQRMEDLI